MTSSTKVSVIIPSYKPGNYIWECLASLEAQTFGKSNFEIILVLNGCNEPWTGQIRQWFVEHNELNVNFIQTDEGGVSNARNIAMDQAKGEYITFIDDDDYVSPRYLEALLEKATPETVVLSDSLSFQDGITGFDISYKQHKVFQRCAATTSQSLIRARSIFNGPVMKLLPISYIHGASFNKKLKNGEDSLFMFQISRHIRKLDYAPEAVYYRRYRENSAVTSKKTFGYSLRNTSIILNKYVATWRKAPFRYNLPFFLTRLLGAYKNFVLDIINLTK